VYKGDLSISWPNYVHSGVETSSCSISSLKLWSRWSQTFSAWAKLHT